MSTGLSISKNIYSILSGDTQLSGTTIYPIVAPEEVKYPYLVYKRTDLQPIYAKNMICGDKARVEINIVSDKYSQTVSISERVRELLEYRKDNFFKEVFLKSAEEGWNDFGYFQTITFDTMTFREI